MTTNADFLSEGAKSYIDALSAIEAFEGLARGACKAVYEKYKPQLVSKMGIRDADCHDHDNKDDLANGIAELGVWQTTTSGREWLYVYLMWKVAKDGAIEVSACVSIQFSTKNDRNKCAELLRNSPSIQPGDAGYYLWSQRNLSDLSSCTEAFCSVLDEWLACWPAGRRLK